MNNKIIGYIHICQKGEWKRSFDMIFNYLQNSGLYDQTIEIRCGILSDTGIIDYDERLKDPKIKIIYTGKSGMYERPTLLDMKSKVVIDSFESNTEPLYWYLHTKGLRHFGTEKESYVMDWIRLMLYWIVIKWKLAISKLKEYDTYGCNEVIGLGQHGEIIGMFYSGNFWWTKGSHLSLLPIKIKEHYTGPEEWILTKHDKRLNIFSSGIEGDGHYLQNYPRELYYLQEDRYLLDLPEDFNVYNYKRLNYQIKDKSIEFCINHFLTIGKKENLLYKKSDVEKNINNILPLDFDFIYYRYYYNDLNNMSFEELKNHWLNNGKNEGRIYRGEYIIPEDFDFNFYRNNYPDLIHMSNIELIEHWNKKGKFTNRIYKNISNNQNSKIIKNNLPLDFDVIYYKNKHDDLKNMTNEELINHWIQKGQYENRTYKHSNKLPNDFIPSVYQNIYPDLLNLSEEELKFHWLNNGIIEGRKYK